MPTCPNCACLNDELCSYCKLELEGVLTKLHEGGAVALEVPPESAIAVKNWLESRTLQLLNYACPNCGDPIDGLFSDSDPIAPAECAECRGECPDCGGTNDN